MNRTIVRLFRQGNTQAIAIPRPFRHALKLALGDQLFMELVNGRLVITPIELAIEEQIEERRKLQYAPPPEVG